MVRGVAAVLLAIAPLVSSAQSTPETAPPVDFAPLGGAISVPLPSSREKDLEKYEIPELAGSRPASGSQLVGGELPLPLVDYTVRYPRVLQRITIFETGLVAVRIEGTEGTIQKRVIIPEDALAVYKAFFNPDDLAQVASRNLTGESPGTGTIRIRQPTGKVVERTFDPALILPRVIEQHRTVLQDLLRVLAEDRDVTNPMSVYTPRIGDQIVGDDKRSYRVSGIYNAGEIIELTCLSLPMRMYVSAKDLHNLFIGARAAAAPAPSQE